jgi:hypothetical protein
MHTHTLPYLFPMHVVHPNPTMLNPSASRLPCRPDLARYLVTTPLPGAYRVCVV